MHTRWGRLELSGSARLPWPTGGSDRDTVWIVDAGSPLRWLYWRKFGFGKPIQTIVGPRVESGKLTMPFSVAHPIEMDRIPSARIEYGSNNFCLSEFAEADVAEGCGGAER